MPEFSLAKGVSPKLVLAPSPWGISSLAVVMRNVDLGDTKLPLPPPLLRCPARFLLAVLLLLLLVVREVEDADLGVDDAQPLRLEPKAAVEGFGSAASRRADRPRSRRRSGGGGAAENGPGGEDTNIMSLVDDDSAIIVSASASRCGARLDDDDLRPLLVLRLHLRLFLSWARGLAGGACSVLVVVPRASSATMVPPLWDIS